MYLVTKRENWGFSGTPYGPLLVLKKVDPQLSKLNQSMAICISTEPPGPVWAYYDSHEHCWYEDKKFFMIMSVFYVLRHHQPSESFWLYLREDKCWICHSKIIMYYDLYSKLYLPLCNLHLLIHSVRHTFSSTCVTVSTELQFQSDEHIVRTFFSEMVCMEDSLLVW